jgi:trimeric autotransporter adhesin
MEALRNNTIGTTNTATASRALYSNTIGYNNAAHGGEARFNNTSGNLNTASGNESLYSNTTGANNIAVGNGAGFNLTTGSNNIDIGNAGLAGEGRTIRIGTQGTQTRTFVADIFGTAVSGSARLFRLLRGPFNINENHLSRWVVVYGSGS